MVRGLRDRMVSRFRVSAAETAHQDRHAMTELTAAVAAADRRHAERVINTLDAFVRSDPRAQVIESEIAFF